MAMTARTSERNTAIVKRSTTKLGELSIEHHSSKIEFVLRKIRRQPSSVLKLVRKGCELRSRLAVTNRGLELYLPRRLHGRLGQAVLQRFHWENIFHSTI